MRQREYGRPNNGIYEIVFELIRDFARAVRFSRKFNISTYNAQISEKAEISGLCAIIPYKYLFLLKHWRGKLTRRTPAPPTIYLASPGQSWYLQVGLV